MLDREALPVPTPALVLDASAGSVFIGVIGKNGDWLDHRQRDGTALETLFSSVDACLSAADLDLDRIQSFVYSEGPGSVLGLRLCAMAIETWRRLGTEKRPLYRYNTLQLCAALIHQDQPESLPALLVADWKKGVWHSLHVGANGADEVNAIPDEVISASEQPIYHLPQRKGWQPAPSGASEIKYQPDRLTEVWLQNGLVYETDAVELYSAGVNTFQKWTPERHRA